ncbi:hypothetical protein MASR2M8_09170 [Opitutaceae bacterium]
MMLKAWFTFFFRIKSMAFLFLGMLAFDLRAEAQFERVGLIRAAGEVTALALSPDERTLVTVVGAAAPVLWDTANGSKLAELRVREAVHGQMVFSPDGAWLATRHEGNRIRVWRIKERDTYATRLDRPYAEIEPTSREEKEGKNIINGGFQDWAYTAIAFSHDSRTLYIGISRGFVQTWDIERRRMTGQSVYGGPPWRLAIDGLYTPPGPGVLVLQGSSLNNSSQGIHRLRWLDENLRAHDVTESGVDVEKIAFGRAGREAWIVARENGTPALLRVRFDLPAPKAVAVPVPANFPLNPESRTPVVFTEGGLLGIHDDDDTHSMISLLETKSPTPLPGFVEAPIASPGKIPIHVWSPGGRLLVQASGVDVAVFQVRDMDATAAWARAVITADHAIAAYQAGFGAAAVEQIREAVAIDPLALWRRSFGALATRAGMPPAVAGEVAVKVHHLAKADEVNGRWANKSLVAESAYTHALYAVAAGQPALARATLAYLQELDSGADGPASLTRDTAGASYVAALEALVLAAEGRTDDAYGRLLRQREFDPEVAGAISAGLGLDGPDAAPYVAEPWAPLYADPKRLAFVLKVDEARLREVMRIHELRPEEKILPQPYPGLDGAFVQPPAARPPALELKR